MDPHILGPWNSFCGMVQKTLVMLLDGCSEKFISSTNIITNVILSGLSSWISKY